MMKTSFLRLILMAMIMGGLSSYAQSSGPSPIHQLRIYEIPKDNRVPFHDRFAEHALRIMKKYNFHIVSIWESEFEDKLEFVYLLEWKDEATMKLAWEGFMADQEWKDIKKKTSAQHGTFVDRIEDRTLRLVEYSPQRVLLEKLN